MVTYLIKRLLLFIPALIGVSLLAFGLSKLAPGDPVEGICGGDQSAMSEVEYRRCAEQNGLDLPAFYFSFTTRAYPDTLYRILPFSRRSWLKSLIATYGNWEAISEMDRALRRLEVQLQRLPDSTDRQTRIDLKNTVIKLAGQRKASAFRELSGKLDSLRKRDAVIARELRAPVQVFQKSVDRMLEESTPGRNWIPAFYWHGFRNQYHHWVSGFLKGDFGRSYQDRRPVWSKLKVALFWTVLINLCAFTVAFLVAIPLGVFMAVHAGSWWERTLTLILFFWYSLPRFWVATILVVFFTTAEYGVWLDWFASPGLGDLPKDASLWEQLVERAAHLILPVFCLTYGLIAFIARQMRGSMLEALSQDFVRTARAKGIRERQVVWRHAFRNALFPIITLISAVLPATIGGSVVIEVIFAIPGMGFTTFDAIFKQDWPVVFTILMFSAVLTMAGILIGDLLYTVADPRVQLGKVQSRTA